MEATNYSGLQSGHPSHKGRSDYCGRIILQTGSGVLYCESSYCVNWTKEDWLSAL